MENKKPSALFMRQGIQELMTASRKLFSDIQFDENAFDLINVDVKLKHLDEVFEGYKIVNLTDIHLGQWINPTYLEGIVDTVNNLNPDMITLTGDYISYILGRYERPLRKSLKRLKAKDKKLAVLGNHDHWLGEKTIKKILRKANIKDLSNDVYTVKKGESVLHVAGLDSCTVGKDDLKKVMEKMPKTGPAIILAHEPDLAKETSKTHRFGLQMSGHSHGGQFIIPGIETTPFRASHSMKYPVGKYKVGDMIQYTSRGLGTNIFWMRINCKPEITQFILHSPKMKKININDTGNRTEKIKVKKK